MGVGSLDALRVPTMVSDQAYLIVSTPLDDACDAWPKVPSVHMLIAGRDMIAIFLRDKSLAELFPCPYPLGMAK